MYFETKSQAVQWVMDAMARGVGSIDTGCLQVNLFYHPHAFASIEDAFDPGRNADYAARFLLQLHASTGDWRQATGFYHSQTLTLAMSYRGKIERALHGDALTWPGARKPPSTLDRLADAWQATLGTSTSQPVASDAQNWGVLLSRQKRRPPRSLSPPQLYADQLSKLYYMEKPR